MYEIPLNKFEKHDLIIKLLEEGKIYRDICHIAHVSPNHIKRISNEYERKKRLKIKRKEKKNLTKKSPSISTQAFILFQEGKKIDEVKVLLDIPFKKAEIFSEQYLKSIRMEDCYEFYQEFQYYIPTILSISNFMKKNNIHGKNIANVLREANDVINLSQRISNLKAEIEKLEQMKKDYISQILPPIQPLPRHPSSSSSCNGYYHHY